MLGRLKVNLAGIRESYHIGNAEMSMRGTGEIRHPLTHGRHCRRRTLSKCSKLFTSLTKRGDNARESEGFRSASPFLGKDRLCRLIIIVRILYISLDLNIDLHRFGIVKYPGNSGICGLLWRMTPVTTASDGGNTGEPRGSERGKGPGEGCSRSPIAALDKGLTNHANVNNSEYNSFLVSVNPHTEQRAKH